METVQEDSRVEDRGDRAGPKAVCAGEEVQSAAWKVATDDEPDVGEVEQAEPDTDKVATWPPQDQMRQDQKQEVSGL